MSKPEEALREPGEAWDQGDIVDGAYFPGTDDWHPAVLVTPACDIEHGKVDLWTFVALHRDEQVARQVVASELSGWGHQSQVAAQSLTKNQKRALRDRLEHLLLQRMPRYHWIPVTIDEHTGYVADFSNVTSMPAEEVQSKARRIATLVSSWREQLPTRYAAFMGRVGTEDFERGSTDEHVDRLLADVTQRE